MPPKRKIKTARAVKSASAAQPVTPQVVATPETQTATETVIETATENAEPDSPGVSENSRPETQASEEDSEPIQLPKKPKKTKTSIHLSTEQEEAMVDWLKAHELLYNKKLKEYKDTKRKSYLWQKQAKVMGVPMEELLIWYTSLRTRYTKLKKTKSGDGAPEPSQRDQWVMDNFAFLAPYTYTVKKRTLENLKAKIRSTTATTTDPDSLDTEGTALLSGQMTSFEPGTQQQSPTTSRSSTPKPSDSFSSAISGKMDQFLEMQNQLMQRMVRPNTDRMKDAFVDYIRESVYDIHPSLWEEMHRNIMNMVLTYKARDSELKKTQQRAVTTTSTATTATDPCASSVAWQPNPCMWPSTVQNPVSVWGSMEPAWVQQQFPQLQQLSQQQPQQQQQQQPHLFQQQPQQERQQQISPLNTPQLTFLASPLQTESPQQTSFRQLLQMPSGDQQKGVEQEDPLQPAAENQGTDKEV